MPRKKGSGTVKGPTTPLQGAVRTDGNDTENEAALQLILTRLQGMEKQQRLAQQYQEQALKAQEEKLDLLRTTMVEEQARLKAETAQAMELAYKKFLRLVESRPQDPRTQQQLVRAAMEEAKKEMTISEAKFKKELKSMTTGTINHTGADTVRLIINGVDHIIRPGTNRGVPQAFIETWEKRLELQDWAANVNKTFQTADNDANHLQQKLGRPPIWNEDTGVI